MVWLELKVLNKSTHFISKILNEQIYNFWIEAGLLGYGIYGYVCSNYSIFVLQPFLIVKFELLFYIVAITTKWVGATILF